MIRRAWGLAPGWPWRSGLLAGCLVLGLVAGGCREPGPGAAPVAPIAAAERQGDWQGGPEPVSGKLRSGIVSWWRWPAQPLRAGEPFDLTLRLEETRAADAYVSVTASDGAAVSGGPAKWLLGPGSPAEVVVRVVAPPGDSYLHVLTHQGHRASVRSILVSVPADPTRRSATRSDYEVDARGEPIVRMPAKP